MKPSERIRALCNGHPHAKIAWPHRELHEIAEAVEAIEAEHFTPDGSELPTWKQLAELHHRKLSMTEEMEKAGFDAIDEYDRWKAERKFPRPSLVAHIFQRIIAAA